MSDHVRNNWPGCENNSVNQIMEENEILSTLKILSSYYRETQGVEFYANGFNYRINKNGELEKSNLSDYDINNGDFSNEAQYSQFNEVSRFYKDKDGFFQLSAYGIDKRTKIVDGKQIDLNDLASEYRIKANDYLKIKKIKNPDQKVEKEESKALFDNVKFKIANTCAFRLL